MAKKLGFKYIGHQYGGECWMGNEFGKYGQKPEKDCKMKCKLETDLICGGGWRNSIFELVPFTPQKRNEKEAKELNDSIKSIIKDIDDARKDQQEAYRLARKISWITGSDMRRAAARKSVDAASASGQN